MFAFKRVDLVSCLAGGGAVLDCWARGTPDEADSVVVKEKRDGVEYFMFFSLKAFQNFPKNSFSKGKFVVDTHASQYGY